MAHRTGITLRLTPADRTALEVLQAFSQERTATRAIDIAVKRYPDTCRALENAEADRDQARRALQQILDALDKVENARSSLNQVIQGLRQDAGALTYPVRPVCEKTHSFDRFPHFWGVPEKSDCRKSPLSDLNDSPQGLTGRYNLWADASSCNEYLTPLEN